MPKTLIEGYRCERCGHTWVPHSDTKGEPTICPKCKSPYWDRPRLSEMRSRNKGVKAHATKLKEMRGKNDQ